MADLGRKHHCFKCSSKFYDLKKPKALCPKCGSDQADAPLIVAPPPPPVKRAPRMVDPVEEPEPVEAAEGEEGAAAVDDDAELDLDTEDAVGVEEEVDEPAGEDSYD